MTIACPAPSETLGVVIRVSTYLDCQSRALGENGFAALSSGPLASDILPGAITVFVALIGYKLILGASLGLGNGVSWAIRLGFVLALATSWPAYQTLVYRVAIDGPAEIAALLLPATGLSPDDVGTRMQSAYDAIRSGVYVTGTTEDTTPFEVGPGDQAVPKAPGRVGIGLPPSPIAASMLALFGVGVTAALRLTVGLLVAVGPLALVGLLFDTTLGLVAGWIRAMIGASLGVLATTLIGALEMAVIESEVARAAAIQSGGLPAASVDSQAFATIATLFALAPLVMSYAMFRAAGGLRLDRGTPRTTGVVESVRSVERTGAGLGRPDMPHREMNNVELARSRAAAISDALMSASHRDLRILETATLGSGRRQPVRGRDRGQDAPRTASVGQSGRRTSARRSRLASRRDGTS